MSESTNARSIYEQKLRKDSFHQHCPFFVLFIAWMNFHSQEWKEKWLSESMNGWNETTRESWYSCLWLATLIFLSSSLFSSLIFFVLAIYVWLFIANVFHSWLYGIYCGYNVKFSEHFFMIKLCNEVFIFLMDGSLVMSRDIVRKCQKCQNFCIKL